MQYLLLFLEGIIAFISPCMLPMIPVYISFFAGGDIERTRSKTLINSILFVIGFSIIFIILGAFAASIGRFLNQHQQIFNIFTGVIVVLFGLNYLGIINILFLNKTYKIDSQIKDLGSFSAILFGMIFAIGWTPCVGAFLGSALMIATQGSSSLEGSLMLLVFSLGLGLPFVVSAVLIERLKKTFNFIKKHYRIVNNISGVFLVLIGILMMTGYMGYLLSILTF